MEFVYFTITANVLYGFSRWLLNRTEVSRGERFSVTPGQNPTIDFRAETGSIIIIKLGWSQAIGIVLR